MPARAGGDDRHGGGDTTYNYVEVVVTLAFPVLVATAWQVAERYGFLAERHALGGLYRVPRPRRSADASGRQPAARARLPLDQRDPVQPLTEPAPPA
jgi:hypothetical protein